VFVLDKAAVVDALRKDGHDLIGEAASRVAEEGVMDGDGVGALDLVQVVGGSASLSQGALIGRNSA
jgi:hypothetical protein